MTPAGIGRAIASIVFVPAVFFVVVYFLILATVQNAGSFLTREFLTLGWVFGYVAIFGVLFSARSPSHVMNEAAASIGTTVALYCLCFGVFFLRHAETHNLFGDWTLREIRGLYLGAFVIFPPIWFFFDFVLTNPSSSNLDRFKHLQELARNIWLAVASVLTGLFFGEQILK